MYVVGDDQQARMFSVKVDESRVLQGLTPAADDIPETPRRREDATRIVRQRICQAEVRRQALDAHRQRCALGSLRHSELLDAAHITADSDAARPIDTNGRALRKLHHAALDGYFIGIRPATTASSTDPQSSKTQTGPCS